MNKENFYTAFGLAEELYGVELTEDQFETYGLIAYNKIGNKHMILKHMDACAVPDEKNGGFYVEKPCDMDQIEAITLPYEDAQETSNIDNYPDIKSRPIENWIESRKTDPNPLYISGKMVNFNEVGDRIYFTEPFHNLHILYKSLLQNPDELPYLNEKELYAVATYCAYCWYRKQSLMTRSQAMMQMATNIKQDWYRACAAAKNPEYITQNSINEMLNVTSTWDRHMYGKTQKIIN